VAAEARLRAPSAGTKGTEGEERFAVGFEDFTDEVGGFGGPGIVSVADFVAAVGFGHGRERLRADARVIVTGELPPGQNFGTHARHDTGAHRPAKDELGEPQPVLRDFLPLLILLVILILISLVHSVI
jgi:hypothetical protein